MAHQERKYGSKSTQMLAQEITLLRVTSVATLAEMAIVLAGNVVLAEHTKKKNQILGFIAFLK